MSTKGFNLDEITINRIEYLADSVEMSYSAYIRHLIKNTCERLLDAEEQREPMDIDRVNELRQLLNYPKFNK